jgi:site-specific recombinase XerD
MVAAHSRPVHLADLTRRSTLRRHTGIPEDLRWYDARHEFVSSLIEEGGTVQEVKEAARHRSITTTAKYMKAHED